VTSSETSAASFSRAASNAVVLNIYQYFLYQGCAVIVIIFENAASEPDEEGVKDAFVPPGS